MSGGGRSAGVVDRRRFLLAAGGIAGLAGCQSTDPDPTSSSGSPSGGTPASSATPPATTAADGRVDVAIRTARYRVRSYRQTPEQRAIDPDEVVGEADLPESLRTALRAARDDGYETDAASDDLLAAIDSFRHNGGGYRFEPYVRLDGTPYRFDPTVPVFVARLEEVEGDVDPERTVDDEGLDEFDEPVRDLVRTIGAFTTMVPRDEYRISIVPEPVRAFLDEYDYVRDPDTVGRIATERVDPGPPYTIEVSELSTADLWGRRVVEVGTLPADLRLFLESVLASDRRAPVHPPTRTEHRTDSVPSAYFERLDADPGFGPYVVIDGSTYAFDVREPNRSEIPISVSVAAGSADGRPAFTVRLEPSGGEVEGPVEFEARGALPSVLWVQAGSARVLLPSEAYESVERSDEPDERRIRNLVRAEVAVGESLSATYRVPEGVPAGTHDAWGLFGVSWTDADTGQQYPFVDYPFQVSLTVDE